MSMNPNFPDRKEFILCAAYWCKDEEALGVKRPEVLRPKGISPYNVDSGVVFCGWRHANVIYQIVSMAGKRMHEIGEYEDGFLTSDNRFVGREEAKQIAIKAGQVKPDFRGTIFSEDLW